MCGLSGMIGRGVSKWDIDVIRELTYVSGLRGWHSTGVVQGRVNSNLFGKNQHNLQINKHCMSPSYYLWYNKSHKDGDRNILDNCSDNLFAVHTRHATKGSVTEDNAHPFEFEHIIGMHNGTLHDKKYQHDEKTDSELLFQDINDRGMKVVLEELDPDSAYAIVVFDKRTGLLQFARNHGRPLHFAINSKRGVLYWSSEKAFLTMAFDRNDISIVDDQITPFSAFKIFSIEPDKVKVGIKEQWYIEEYKPREKPAVVVHSPRGWGHGLPFDNFLNQRDERTKENENSQLEKKGAVLSIKIKQEKLKNKIPIGSCSACQSPMPPIDMYYGTLISSQHYICEDCANERKDNEQEVAVG